MLRLVNKCCRCSVFHFMHVQPLLPGLPPPPSTASTTTATPVELLLNFRNSDLFAHVWEKKNAQIPHIRERCLPWEPRDLTSHHQTEAIDSRDFRYELFVFCGPLAACRIRQLFIDEVVNTLYCNVFFKQPCTVYFKI